MPHLVRAAFAPAEGAAPYAKMAILADAAGGVYLYGQSLSEFLLVRLDSTGEVLARFGRPGEGPGELSGLGVLLGVGDTVLVYDTGRAAIVLFEADGTHLGDTPVDRLAFPLAVTGGTVHEFDATAALQNRSPTIDSRPIGRGRSDPATLVDTTWHAFRDALGLAEAGRGQLPLPAYAAGFGFLAIGDPRTGQIAVVRESDTQRLAIPGPPPRRGPKALEDARTTLERVARRPGRPANARLVARLDTLDREVLPFVAWPGLALDSHGRIWAIREGSDSTLIDVFLAGRHLGRTSIPCHRPDKGISLRGEWLALQCKALDGEDVPYRIQLYRIVG